MSLTSGRESLARLIGLYLMVCAIVKIVKQNERSLSGVIDG